MGGLGVVECTLEGLEVEESIGEDYKAEKDVVLCFCPEYGALYVLRASPADVS